MLLPAECLEQLKCSICEELLSRFPIYVTKDNDNKLLSICGRCEIPSDDKSYLRNIIYESAMKNVQFPCINRQYGCMEYLLPENIEQHEFLCQYQTINCGICEWNGRSFTVLDHYQTKHADLILKNYKFKMNIEKDSNSWNILLHKETIFSFERNVDEKMERIKCTVTPLFSTKNIKKYYAQINLTVDDTTVSKRFPEIDIVENKPKSIDINIEKIVNDNTTEAIGIIIITNDINELNLNKIGKQFDENLSNLRCNLDALVISMTNFDTSLQSSSNQLLNLTYQPCQYGCKYTPLTVSKLKQHYDSCWNKPYNCFFTYNKKNELRSCEELISRNKLRDHIWDEHISDNVSLSKSLSLTIEVGRLAKKQYRKCLYYNNFVFILIIQHVEPHLLLWRVEVLRPNETTNNFAFEITMSNKNNNAKLSLRESCATLTCKKIYNINDIPCLWLHLDQLHHFITYNTLSFEISFYNGSDKLY